MNYAHVTFYDSPSLDLYRITTEMFFTLLLFASFCAIIAGPDGNNELVFMNGKCTFSLSDISICNR